MKRWMYIIFQTSGGLIGLGAFLVVMGFVIPFLMVMRLIPSSFLIAFVSYAASVTGMTLGLVGAARHVADSSEE